LPGREQARGLPGLPRGLAVRDKGKAGLHRVAQPCGAAGIMSGFKTSVSSTRFQNIRFMPPHFINVEISFFPRNADRPSAIEALSMQQPCWLVSRVAGRACTAAGQRQRQQIRRVRVSRQRGRQQGPRPPTVRVGARPPAWLCWAGAAGSLGFKQCVEVGAGTHGFSDSSALQWLKSALQPPGHTSGVQWTSGP
jgi:hypothetical protein